MTYFEQNFISQKDHFSNFSTQDIQMIEMPQNKDNAFSKTIIYIFCQSKLHEAKQFSKIL